MSNEQLLREALQTIKDLTHDRLFTAEWASKHGATVAKLDAALAQPAEGGEDDGNPLSKRCYTMSESHLSGYRLIVGFESLGDAQAAHSWVANIGRTTPPASQEPCKTCRGVGLIGGFMQDGSGHGEGCPDCNPEPPAIQEQAVWCEYVAGMVDHWVRTEEYANIKHDEDRCTKAIAGIIERRLWALKRDTASQDQAQQPIAASESDMKVYQGIADNYFKAQQPIKDHQIAQIVNQLRDIAIEFGGTQQLRERIAVVIVPMLKAQQPKPQPMTGAPEIVERVMRYAGKTMREARNPCITARETIVLADWLASHGITGDKEPC